MSYTNIFNRQKSKHFIAFAWQWNHARERQMKRKCQYEKAECATLSGNLIAKNASNWMTASARIYEVKATFRSELTDSGRNRFSFVVWSTPTFEWRQKFTNSNGRSTILVSTDALISNDHWEFVYGLTPAIKIKTRTIRLKSWNAPHFDQKNFSKKGLHFVLSQCFWNSKHFECYRHYE